MIAPSRDALRQACSQRLYVAHCSSSLIWSATLSACAAIVSPGLTAADEGKNEASTTNRFPISCARQYGSSTECRGSVPKHTVPHWCVVFRPPCECLTTHQKPSRRSIRLVSFTSRRCALRLLGR